MLVYVYFNLHRKCWSIKDWKTKRVIAHRKSLYMRDCKFKVSEAGRQRVLRERRKNVHAGILGYWLSDVTLDPGGMELVTYNPYKGPNFVKVGDGSPVFTAKSAWFEDKTVHARRPI